jgi:hypothetical protein
MIFKKFFQISIFLLSLASIPLAAEGATLYFTPQSQTIFQGDSFIIDVKIDTEGEEINAAGIDLTFSMNLLEVIDFSKGNSILTLWPKEPEAQKGNINFLGGAPIGFDGDGLLTKIIFLAKEIGNSKINFKDSSKVLLNDGKGTPAEISFREGNYEIIKRPEDLPIVSSQSHPDQNQWYNATTLRLHWDLIEGAEYSYLLSFNPLAEPDEVPDKPEGKLIWMGDMKYEGLADGIYYFSLKQRLLDEDWSQTITYRAMIDTILPEPFELKIGREPSIFEGKYFLSFTTEDNTSGIDYYEVKEGKGNWQKVSTPYLLKSQSLTKKITVRAYDKAGNYREAEIKPSLKMNWKNGLYLVLILIGIGVIWRFLKKIKK